MRLSCVAVIDQSSMFKGTRSAVLDGIVQAVQIQVERDFCPAWGRVPIPVFLVQNGFPVPIGAGLVYLVDRIDQTRGAVGFHQADPLGFFSGAVAVETIARLGGTMTSGSDSVSSALSHEVLEVIQNPGVNYWVDTGSGESVAMEICDPVSADYYEIEIDPSSGGGPSRISVSNFVHPNWFHPFSPSGSRYDQMQVLDSAFQSRPGGYVSFQNADGLSARFGSSVPEPRRDRVSKLGRCIRAHEAMSANSVVALHSQEHSKGS